MSTASENAESAPQPISPIEIIRVIVLLAALVTFSVWGFTAWSSPWNFVFGIGAPVVALLIWALVLSTKPVVAVHPFVRAFIELVVYAGATAAWWSMGSLWAGVAFAVVAIAVGLASGLAALRD